MITIKRFALAAILFCTPALAQQWAPAEYNSEYEACVPACDKNNPTAHSGCQNYCHCVMDMLQSQFPNHAQINADFEAKKPETMSSVQNIANTCNRKFFGGDARKVQ